MNYPSAARTMTAAQSLISHYYGLRIKLPYYAGGYFWWFYAEDCVPFPGKPLWTALDRGIRAEAAGGPHRDRCGHDAR